ncbi:MAG: flagellar basal body P-ring formation protein FlgA [Magnetococcales bacterium]|nr:flagellar basal body P-ring formation protein FlgA [Magnetococcales bacterium]
MRLIFTGIVGFAVVLLTSAAWSQEISAEALNREVMEQMRHYLAGQKSELRVEGAGYRYPLMIPDGTWECVVETGSLTMSPGQHWVETALLIHGQTEKKVRVPVTLKWELRLPVARKALQRGQRVGADDLEWQVLNMVRNVPDVIRDDKEIVSLVANRRVNPGEALQRSWFERPMDVERGEQVRVLAGGSGFSIEAVAVALDQGRVGDLIQLRNPDTQIRYEARISAPGTVSVSTR